MVAATLEAAVWGAELATGNGHGSGEILECPCHSNKVLQNMLDHLEKLKKQGIEAIND